MLAASGGTRVWLGARERDRSPRTKGELALGAAVGNGVWPLAEAGETRASAGLAGAGDALLLSTWGVRVPGAAAAVDADVRRGRPVAGGSVGV